MAIEIKVIHKKDLFAFYEEQRAGWTPGKLAAINYLRCISHMNNPHAEPDDPSLFLFYQGTQLLGYMGTMAGLMLDNGSIRKVLFTTTAYVPEDFRKLGAGVILVRSLPKLPGDAAALDNRPDSTFIFSHLKTYHPLNSLVLHRLSPREMVNLGNRETDYNATLNRQLSVGGLKPLVDSTRSHFVRTAETVNWMTTFPWTNTDYQPTDMEKSYFFDTPYPEFGYMFLDIFDRSKKQIATLVLSRIRTHYETFSKIKLLDLFIADHRIDYLSLIICAGQVFADFNVDIVEVPDIWLQNISMSSDQKSILANARPARIVNGYFKPGTKAQGNLHVDIARTSADGDIAFA